MTSGIKNIIGKPCGKGVFLVRIFLHSDWIQVYILATFVISFAVYIIYLVKLHFLPPFRFGAKHSKMEQVKLVEDSLSLGPFLNTLSHLLFKFTQNWLKTNCPPISSETQLADTYFKSIIKYPWTMDRLTLMNADSANRKQETWRL